MPDHVASASMWPHFPDEAIIILIIMVIMAFQEITIHHPQPGRKMLILYDICFEFYTTTIIGGNLTCTKSACLRKFSGQKLYTTSGTIGTAG